MAKSVVTLDRFARGMTFEEYVTYTGSPENLAREGFGSYYPDGGSIGTTRRDNSAVFRERYARARLADYQLRAIKWLAAQPSGPAKILVVSEDWSSDCRRDVKQAASRCGSSIATARRSSGRGAPIRLRIRMATTTSCSSS